MNTVFFVTISVQVQHKKSCTKSFISSSLFIHVLKDLAKTITFRLDKAGNPRSRVLRKLHTARCFGLRRR
jgi:hypothetical protein